MTRLLLDTHTLLWALTDPARLSAAAREAIADRGNQRFVSAASAWELGTKYRLGKLPTAEVVIIGYDDHVARLETIQLDVTSRHALDAGALVWGHRDPVDRMLAVQAMHESLTLVTADPAFTGLPGVRLLW